MNLQTTAAAALAALLIGCGGSYFSQAFTEWSRAIKETPRSWSISADSAGVVRLRARTWLISSDYTLTTDTPERFVATPAPDRENQTRLEVTLDPIPGDSLRVTVSGSGSSEMRVENTVGSLALYARTGRNLDTFKAEYPEE